MPKNRDHRLDRAVRRIVRQIDPRRPHAAQLEQAVGTAIGYGLWRAAQGRSLAPTSRPSLRSQIEVAVDSFATETNQAALEQAAEKAGVPPEEVLAGIVLKHCHEDLKPLTAEQVARYGLEFALALAETRPLLAARYRRWLGKRAGLP